ncbi:MAG: Flp pilus assembly protein CpaB [Deltaproteobacteria bacterium]|nr:Flp pilus assembly protein CpaB [Deltaproteobacteria bacterium]
MTRKWIAALALGAAAGGLHFAYVRSLAAEVRGGEIVEVLVAARDVGKGRTLDEKATAGRRVPEAWVEGRAVRMTRAKEVLGLPLAVDLSAGDAVQWSDFAERPSPGAGDLARLVPSGNRALAIPVNAALSMGGLLRPGHRVDILGTFARGGDRRGDKTTVTLLQNVVVLATGQDVGAGDKGNAASAGAARYGTVTLSVSLEQAELLSFASTQGSLSLVLRGYQDLEVVEDVPEKGQTDVWEAERRTSLQRAKGARAPAIERLKVR